MVTKTQPAYPLGHDCEDEGRPKTLPAIFAGILLIAFAICLARAVHPSQRFSFWGEDGVIFTSQVRANGIIHSFFTTYGGYFLFLPRAVAGLASAFPLEWSPPIYAGAAMLLSALVATIAFRAGREGLRLSAGSASVLAGMVLLLPAAGAETFSTLTNMEWYCLAGLLVYVVAWFEGWQTRPVLTGILLFVAATTTPLAAAVLPFLIVRLVKGSPIASAPSTSSSCFSKWRGLSSKERRLDIAVLTGLVGGIITSLLGHLISHSRVPLGPVDLGRLTSIYGVRVVDNSVLGDRLISPAFFAMGELTMLVVASAVFLLIVVVALVRTNRWTTLLLTLTSVVLYITPAWIRGLSSLPHLGFGSTQVSGPEPAGRYFGVPALCLVMVMLLVLRPARDNRGSMHRRHRQHSFVSRPLGAVPTVINVVLGAVLIFNVPVDLARQPLRSWEQSVRQARFDCRTHHGQGLLTVSNAPSPGFGVRLTCRQAFGE